MAVRITQHRDHRIGFTWHIDCDNCGEHFEESGISYLYEIQYEYCLIARDNSVVCPNCPIV